jgi:dihydrofolate reductase
MTHIAIAAFLGLSVDGYIARQDGSIDWLVSRGESSGGDNGYSSFMADVDLVALGRETFETVLEFATWPYPGLPVVVLSERLKRSASAIEAPLTTVAGSLEEMIDIATRRKASKVYADGGRVVQSLLRAGLLDELTLTWVPVLLGGGRTLFGALERDVELRLEATTNLGAGMVQSRYRVLAT